MLTVKDSQQNYSEKFATSTPKFLTCQVLEISISLQVVNIINLFSFDNIKRVSECIK